MLKENVLKNLVENIIPPRILKSDEMYNILTFDRTYEEMDELKNCKLLTVKLVIEENGKK